MIKLKGNNTFYCFSSGVMLATFLIEIAYILFILWRYKLTPLARIAVVMLACLAAFQLTEYFICTDAVYKGEFWSRVGFLAITFLPPLGIHFVYAIVGRGWNKIITAAYGTALAWAAVFILSPSLFNPSQCSGNYVIFDFTRWGGIYFIYYYFWLYIGTLISLKFWLKLPKSKQKVRKSLLFFIIAYLELLLPTMVVNMIHSETQMGIPSIMCGFAVVLASVITILIVPKLVKPKR